MSYFLEARLAHRGLHPGRQHVLMGDLGPGRALGVEKNVVGWERHRIELNHLQRVCLEQVHDGDLDGCIRGEQR